MNESERNFLILLNRAVHKRNIELIAPIDFNAILRLAKDHNLLSLVFEELCLESDFKNQPEYHSMKQRAAALVMMQINRTNSFLKLYKALSDKGFYPIVLKGIVCRSMYGELSDHRPSGDEDLLIKASEFNSIRRILEEQGYYTNKKLTDSNFKKLREISFWGKNTKLHIELHLSPIGHENDLRSQMDEYFANAYENYRELNINGITIRTMNHTDHFLYLVFHSFKHFAAGGLGIRQMLDTLLYYEQFGSELDMDYLKKAFKETHTELFFADLVYLGNKYLGFDLPQLFSPNCPEDLISDILGCGVFGNCTQVYRSAQPLVSAAVKSRTSGGLGKKIRTATELIFPGKTKLMREHPEINEKPWLIIVIWGKRWGRFIRHNSENGGKLAEESIKLGKKRIELLKKYDVL